MGEKVFIKGLGVKKYKFCFFFFIRGWFRGEYVMGFVEFLIIISILVNRFFGFDGEYDGREEGSIGIG